MSKTTIEDFMIIGLSVRTTNENGQSATDIGALWQKFMSNDVLNAIPNKIDGTIFSIYMDYEGDHTQPYTTILGCKVTSLDEIPEGMTGKRIKGGDFSQFLAKGDLTKGAVYGTWLEIWQMDIDRAYSADFEVYGDKAQNPNDAEVPIFVSVK